jgi:hypothetical protein
MHSHWERFREATLVLAGSGSIKQRLAEAYQKHLQDLDPQDLPRELRGPLAELIETMQRGKRTGSLDAVAASVLKLSEAEAARHAQAVVRIFAGLHDQPPAARAASMLRAVPADDEPPAFLSRA